MVQEVRPPLIPDDAHVMTVLINHPPGAAGYPPHRLPGGPAFGYMIDGEMLFELEGVAPRVLRAGDAFWGPAATRSTIRTLTTALTFLVASSSQCCACPGNRCSNGLPKRSLRSERACASTVDWFGHKEESPRCGLIFFARWLLVTRRAAPSDWRCDRRGVLQTVVWWSPVAVIVSA